MKTKPDKYYDLAIVDPPYGNNLSGGRSVKNGWNNKIDWDKCNKGWNLVIPTPEYFNELRRISKHQIVWGGNYFTDMLPASECWIIWDKGQRDFSLADGEMAWCSYDKALRIYTLPRAIANQEKKIHPTQKPVKLYDWIFNKFSKPGMKVIDTHGGSMSIAIAADNYNVDLDITEADKEYFEAGVARYKEHKRQLTMYQNPKAGSAEQKTLKIFTDND